jgi:hypothetical protein
MFFLNVHYIKIIPQQVPQIRPLAPTLTILTLPFLLKLPRSHILDLLKLLLQLFFSEIRWLLAGFSFSIEFFASPPMMVWRKKMAVPDKADLVSDSLRARVFVTTHTRLIIDCDPP